MPYRTILIPALLGTAMLAGCATVTGGTTEKIALSTPGAETASCRLTDGKSLDKTVTAPSTISIHKHHAPITVACNAAGQQTATRVFKPTYSKAARVQAPGGYAIDAISGAMWTYPAEFVVPFGAAADPSPAPSPAPRSRKH